MTFFFGLLFPVFIMVALVRISMNDMQVISSVWSWWTLVFTVAISAVGTVLESSMKHKPNKKIGEK